jgi:signal peptidase I
MEPNYHTGERLIVNKIIYSIRKPERGEVVVFHAPAGIDYIKRVIAVPGEKVKIENNKIYINGEELKEDYLQEVIDERAKNGQQYNSPGLAETTVPEGSVFVLGDNRPNSQDSRMIGAIPYEEIVGRADIRFWPLNKLGIMKH